MKKKFGVLMLMLFSFAATYAQVKVNGKIVGGDQKPLPGVGIIVSNAKDSTEKILTTTDINGNFNISGLRANSAYFLKTSYVGFEEARKFFQTNAKDVNIGAINLKQKSKLLDEVVIEGQKTPVVQKGDTTEMSASAYKVNVDANAQDLVQKMPGVTVENGTVKAHGEEVKRVLVDGKNFFGEDASMALQNLPAEVIDKVQIYNKQSDQSEFTGFDDGNSSKVLNIVTRMDRRKGENGTLTAGHDYEEKYLVNGRLSVFRGDRKLTITGGMNNVNQQNFSSQDLIGAMGSGRRGGSRGGSSFFGQQSGLNRPAAIGINYADQIGKKLNVAGSYFFNSQNNFTQNTSNLENINRMVDTLTLPKYQNQFSNSNFKNFNHRFDMRLEYTIDSANSVIFSPRFSTQQNNSNSLSDQSKFNISNENLYLINDSSINNGTGYTYAGDLTFRHRFGKKGRTISLGIGASGNLQETDGIQYSLTQSPNAILTVDLNSNSTTKGSGFSSNLAYTEPVGSNGMLQLSYNANFNNNSADKRSFDNVTDQILTKYSNVYENSYNTQRGGLSYMFRGGDKLFATAGVDYQLASLSGKRTYPGTSNVDTTFKNFLPNLYLNYKFSQKSNLRVFYRASTNPPSVNQLQDVITVSNSLYYGQGNPDLGHEYSHRGMVNYRFSNSERFTNFGINLFGTYTRNSIGNAIYYVKNDSIIQSGAMQDTIRKGGQLSKPMNFGDSWNTRLFFNYGFLFKPIKCNLNFVGGAGYTTTPGSVNNILRTTDMYSMTAGLVVASNINENVDFTMSYMGNYNISTVQNNGILSAQVARMLNTNSQTWNHSISLNSNFTIFQRLLLQNTVSEQINTGLGAFNQNYLLWNASIGMKVFKNKAGQVKLSAYDLLNQNKNISHSVTTTAISDSRTNTLQRFFLLTFTYTIRSYGGNDGEDGERHRFFGPGGGGGYGHDHSHDHGGYGGGDHNDY